MMLRSELLKQLSPSHDPDLHRNVHIRNVVGRLAHSMSRLNPWKTPFQIVTPAKGGKTRPGHRKEAI